MELNGAEILVDCLQKEGVDHVFGYPGGAVLHIYDAIEAQDKITHVLVRHEQGAAHVQMGMREPMENQVLYWLPQAQESLMR